MFTISESPYFQYFIMGTILINTLMMAIKTVDETKETVEFIQGLNDIFVFIYFFEAIIKISAYGSHYFSDNWNNYDCLLTVFSCVMMPI